MTLFWLTNMLLLAAALAFAFAAPQDTAQFVRTWLDEGALERFRPPPLSAASEEHAQSRILYKDERWILTTTENQMAGAEVCWAICSQGGEEQLGPCGTNASRQCCEDGSSQQVEGHKVCQCQMTVCDAGKKNAFKQYESRCVQKLRDPEAVFCAGDYGLTSKCSTCLAQHPLELKLLNCTKPEQDRFCNPGKPLTKTCLAEFEAAFIPSKNRPGKAGSYLDMIQGFGSWGMHINDPGHYYQCNALDGFHYWVDNLYEFTSPPWKPPPGAEASARRVLRRGNGGRGKQQQQHNVAICIPDACSNEEDARRIFDDYVHYGLMHYWLASASVHEPMAPPLDIAAKRVIGVMVACAATAIVATLLNSTWLARCQAAMPMEEDIDKRLKVPSPFAVHCINKYPDRISVDREMSGICPVFMKFKCTVQFVNSW